MDGHAQCSQAGDRHGRGFGNRRDQTLVSVSGVFSRADQRVVVGTRPDESADVSGEPLGGVSRVAIGHRGQVGIVVGVSGAARDVWKEGMCSAAVCVRITMVNDLPDRGLQPRFGVPPDGAHGIGDGGQQVGDGARVGNAHEPGDRVAGAPPLLAASTDQGMLVITGNPDVIGDIGAVEPVKLVSVQIRSVDTTSASIIDAGEGVAQRWVAGVIAADMRVADEVGPRQDSTRQGHPERENR
jgi:hypothetical protein